MSAGVGERYRARHPKPFETTLATHGTTCAAFALGAYCVQKVI